MAEAIGISGRLCNFVQRKSSALLCFHEVMFSLNIASAIGYSVLLYVLLNQVVWPVQPSDSTYYFFRSAFRLSDFLHFPSIEPVSVQTVARQFPSPWSQRGEELLVFITVLSLAATVFLFVRLAARSSMGHRFFTYVAGLTALFALPAGYLFVSALTWRWSRLHFASLPDGAWHTAQLEIFVVELLGVMALLFVYAKRPTSIRMIGILAALHSAFWLWVFWPSPAIGLALRTLYAPYILLAPFPCTAAAWLLYLQASRAKPPVAGKAQVGRWTVALAVLAAVVLVVLWAPPRRTNLTRQDIDSLTIELSRGPCFGSCPFYTLTIHGNGAVEYNGIEFVRVFGMRTSSIRRAQLIQILQLLDRANFSALDGRAFMWCDDTPSVAVSISAKGTTKRVVGDSACRGARSGEQSRFVEAAYEIEQITGFSSWVYCEGGCHPSVR